MDDAPIVALATPPGRSAVAVLRVSGRGSADVLSGLTRRSSLVARRATLVDLTLGEGFDERALVTWFPAPHSYTGEDSFEVAVHGSPVVVAAALEALGRHGVRGARPGEFTERAFLHGKLDLVEAEAVDDLIRAVTRAQARVASAHLRGALSGPLQELARALVSVLERLEASLDFPDEGYHFIDEGALARSLREVAGRCERLAAAGRQGRVLRDGATVVIVGRPNVGKSSVFNALLGSARAIVTEVPGTTRDVLAERVDLGGVPVTLADTAGLGTPVDPVEREGVARARASAEDADVVMVVIDATEVDPARQREDAAIWESHAARPRVLVANKADLLTSAATAAEWLGEADPCVVSARRGDGLEALRGRLGVAVGASDWEPATVTNARHLGLLERAAAAVTRAIGAVDGGATEEYVALDVREALQALEEIRGRVTAQDVLDGIFARFCIGK